MTPGGILRELHGSSIPRLGGLPGGECLCLLPHRVFLAPEELHEIEPLKRGESIELEAGDEEIVVSPEDSPFLRIDRRITCSLLRRATEPLECAWPRFFSVEDVEVLEKSVWLRVPGPLPDVELSFSELERVDLVWDPPERRPLFGVTLYVMGPSRLPFSFGAQWHPWAWLAVDGGIALPIPHLGGSVWTGLRLRPFAIGPFRPFVGAFANAGAYSLPEDSPEHVSHTDYSAGPRVGFDLLLKRRLLITGEIADFSYRTNPAVGLLHEQNQKRFRSGGVSLTILF